ncbi:MAG: PQQ-binding-like beta-propeller repeat protein [Solirubrobacteraceae bacterium]
MALCLVALLVAGPLSADAQAEPAWTTYHHDAERSGFDPEAGDPIAPVLAWHTAELGAPIWNQPLVLGGRVYVATVGDEVYALEAATGAVVWKKSVGVPVPSGKLPCGDIQPTVGVVGTPVIDPAADAIYLVADTWDAQSEEAHHLLKGLDLASGEEVLSTPVDPPGADPKALLQRTALNLDANNVIFGFGGNDGDCADYQGTVAAVPISGGAARFWQYRPASPSTSGGAVWAPGGPAVDGEGYVYATTGNPDPPANTMATKYDYSDSVVKLSLSRDFIEDPALGPETPSGWFAPPNWEEESNHDLDLSSAGAEPLPGGLLFQSGKDGVGYLIDEATMSSGAPAVFQHRVCIEEGSEHGASFGGDAFAGGVIYIPCENGVEALAYNEAQRTFSSLWQGPPDAVGPPIMAAGSIWSVATGRFDSEGKTLYGLDPATGTPRYTEMLPSVTIDHFASPSAAGNRLFLATGSSVTAYQIAENTVNAPKTIAIANHLPPVLGGPPSGIATLLHRHLRASRSGRVRVALRCATVGPVCQGKIVLWAKFPQLTGKGRRAHHRLVLIKLVSANFGPAKGTFSVTLKLDKQAMRELRRHRRRLALKIAITPDGRSTQSFACLLT